MAGKPADDGAPQDGDKPPVTDTPPEDKGGEGGKGEKTFSQAEVDEIVKARLKRERDKAADEAAKAKQEAEAAAAKAKEEAEAAALAEQNKFKELAEKRQGQIAKLEAERDQLKAQADTLEKYKAALTKFRDAELKDVADHLKPLLEKADLPEQLEWLAANRETLKKGKDGVPPTPPPEGDGNMSEEQRKAAQDMASRHYAHMF